jgi:small-conductance mechanosensitive channel
MIFPNSVLVGKTICNYSRQQQAQGLLVYSTVTIGYTTPWRQVHAMLREAADKTPGVRREPQPFVLQRALGDYYVEYEINAFAENPRLRRTVLSALHENIQDVFNSYGVQIMSPHYVADPAQKVWVPKEQWFAPPAKKTG